MHATGFVLVIIAMALCPILFVVKDGHVVINAAIALGFVADWFSGLADGSSWIFSSGSTTWNFADVVPKFAFVTLSYLAIPGILGLVGGFAFGLTRDPLRSRHRHRFTDTALNALFALPDFVLAVLLQLLVIVVLDITGHKLFTISYDTSHGILLALPLVVMTLYPLIYSYRMVLRSARHTSGASFMVDAEARGVSKASLRYKHMGVAVLASMKTELPSIVAIMMTSIFVVEYSFSLPGMTRWLFTVAFSGSRRGWYDNYQFALALNILLCMAAAYFITMLVLRLTLASLKAAVVHAL
ncbi:MAG TPA: hypothetical protein VMX33_00560 [bacterium]|nr:hypothetical protein [bacterium]